MSKNSTSGGGSGSYRRGRYHYNATLVGLLVTAVLIAALELTTEWPFYLNWLLSLSVTTFMLFGMDKGLAVANQKRVPEIVLHLFTLLGGFLGQFFGRIVFRHKISRGKSLTFNGVLIVSILLHAGLIYFLYFRN
jgi:uncharacterized membrane protein YsdA (DUF1294 family)